MKIDCNKQSLQSYQIKDFINRSTRVRTSFYLKNEDLINKLFKNKEKKTLFFLVLVTWIWTQNNSSENEIYKISFSELLCHVTYAISAKNRFKKSENFDKIKEG